MPSNLNDFSHDDACDVAVVGGGPVGIELAHALKREGVDYRHFEAKQIGHTMSWWAPETRWFSSNERISICGVPLTTTDQSKATREQYLAYLRMLVGAFDLRVNNFEPAVDAVRHDDGAFTLVTSPRGGHRHTRCEKIVLAVGGTDFPRTLGIEGEDLPHVDGYFREPHDYFGQKVLIIGGKNSAAEAALRAHHAGAEVSISYRRSMLPEKSIKYWLTPEITGLIKAGRITAFFETVPQRITPTAVTLSRVPPSPPPGHGERDVEDVEDVEDAAAVREGFCQPGESFDVPADRVLKLIGYEQDKRLFKRLGVKLVGEGRSPAFDEATMRTNVPGVYVAGTAIGGTQGKYRVFLENCHVHVTRIIDALLGREPAGDAEPTLREEVLLQPES